MEFGANPYSALKAVKLIRVRYHYLNHYALFGGGYRSTAMDIMKLLDRKYGVT
jgi:fructosamine-3-kinase